ncbi:phenolic glucoside malonyltransferase 1-like [Aristolochia californica]|uniref:phenolic glucoside malonyltransferase 1-like n=1 Tax=Aristolochia californica TaxID=171875 RepID=UPI0035E0CAC7
MAATVDVVKVLEQRRVSPPLGSVPPTVLALTFFDVIWLPMPPVERVFFYDFLGTAEEFRDSHFPLLERSLSHALTLFYPLAGRLISLPKSDTGDHVIRYSDGDSVSLTLAESSADFNRLVGIQVKEAKEFHPLVPPLVPESSNDQEGKQEMPMIAFQVTVFPRSGVAIGVTVNHVAADGSASTHFMKSWASILKASGDASMVKDPPVCDRTLLGDLEQRKRGLLEDLKNARLGELTPKERPEDKLNRVIRSTFMLTRIQIQKLRDKISPRGDIVGPKLSSFTVMCAYVWVSTVKTREISEGKFVYFGCMADCRRRLKTPVPPAYFGNCVVPIMAKASHAELIQENGLVVAAEAIHQAIRGLDEGVLKDADKWVSNWAELVKERVLSVAGSPRFHVYDTDFGWGQPYKVEIVSIDHNGAMSLAESRDEEGGIEIGMVGPEDEMLRFITCFEGGLLEL